MKALVDATMALAAEEGWTALTLSEIADKAKLSLAELRLLVDGKLDILKRFIADTDARVLEAYEPEPDVIDARDRLFDVLMLRFELLEPHKSALRKIARDLRSDPGSRLALAGSILTSMEWMMRAAEIGTEGVSGSLKSKGLASVYLSAADTWFGDDDPGLARTMAKLDGRLRRGEAWLRNVSIPLGLGATVLQVAASLLRRRRNRSGETASAG